MQHELGSRSSRYRKDVSRMTRTKNFLRQNFFKVFLKTTFFHGLCHPDHYEPKIFFRFSKSGFTLRYTISDSRVLPFFFFSFFFFSPVRHPLTALETRQQPSTVEGSAGAQLVAHLDSSVAHQLIISGRY